MNDASRADEPGSSLTVVLNALVDVVAGHGTVLEDEDSSAVVRDAYHTETTPNQRRIVSSVVSSLDAEVPDAALDGESLGALRNAADAVLANLAADDVRATVTHTARIPVQSRDAHLYTFAVTRDPSVLDSLSLSMGVENAVRTGGERVASGAFDEAAEAFSDAVDASTGDELVTTRVLAAWADHWRGDDDRALDLVEEALHLDMGAWSPRQVGLCAGHRYPEKFRRGKLGVRAFVRGTYDIPSGGSIDAAVGLIDEETERSVTDGDSVAWEPLTGTAACMPVERLAPETRVRLRVSGTLPEFPVVHSYYLGLGEVDLEVTEVREVERILASGPGAIESVESVAFRR